MTQKPRKKISITTHRERKGKKSERREKTKTMAMSSKTQKPTKFNLKLLLVTQLHLVKRFASDLGRWCGEIDKR